MIELDVSRFWSEAARWGERVSPLDPCANSYEFVKRYDLAIDGVKIDFDDKYKHLRAVAEDEHPSLVLMAGAQTGKSALLMTKLVRRGIERWGGMFGYYFPDYLLPRVFSSQRFKPFVQSAPELAAWLGVGLPKDPSDKSKPRGTDAVFTRTLGPTTFMFLSVKGKTSTEGMPMQGVFFDEVRRMSMGDIMRAAERTSAQADPLNVKVSTAYYPDSDIHHYFMEGDQRYFHTECRCPEGVVLSLTWPDCIADLRKATPALRRKVEHAFSHAGLPYLGMTERELAQYGEAAYVCPKCGTVIVDPRDGWWEPHNEGAFVHSYQLPQMLSWTYPAARVLQKSERPDDVQELHNSMRGMPYIDAEAQPVTDEDFLSCVTEEAKWAALLPDRERRETIVNTAMGADCMGGYNCVVLKQMTESGKHRTIHLEVLHGDDPWKAMAKLMVLFDVRLAVIDQNPHYNEAHRFAKQFPGRVFLAVYGEPAGTEGKGLLVKWGDRVKNPKDQKGAETKVRHRVEINRTKGLQWSLKRWNERVNEVPDPDRLIQHLPKQQGRVMLTPGLAVGHWEPTRIAREVYLLHLRRVAFRKQFASDDARRRGQFKLVAEHVGLDPHFAHANLYADVALARLGRRASPKQV